MTWRTRRKVSENTHFEEWWFKTFLSNYGKCGSYYVFQTSFFLELVFILHRRKKWRSITIKICFIRLIEKA